MFGKHTPDNLYPDKRSPEVNERLEILSSLCDLDCDLKKVEETYKNRLPRYSTTLEESQKTVELYASIHTLSDMYELIYELVLEGKKNSFVDFDASIHAKEHDYSTLYHFPLSPELKSASIVAGRTSGSKRFFAALSPLSVIAKKGRLKYYTENNLLVVAADLQTNGSAGLDSRIPGLMIHIAKQQDSPHLLRYAYLEQ